MTETNQARDLLATLRDELHKLAWTLERTRAGVDAIATQAARIRKSVAALDALGQSEDTAMHKAPCGRTRIRDPRRAGGGGRA